MKRRITIEQLNTLTKKQKEALKDLWIPEIGDCFLFCDEIMYIKEDTVKKLLMGFKENSFPILDIGQMIDMLFKKKIYYDLGLVTEDICDELWEILINSLCEDESKTQSHYENKLKVLHAEELKLEAKLKTLKLNKK